MEPLSLFAAAPRVEDAGALLLLGDILICVTLLFFVLVPAITPNGFLFNGGLPNLFFAGILLDLLLDQLYAQE